MKLLFDYMFENSSIHSMHRNFPNASYEQPIQLTKAC
jgi:hypothetical protein